MQRCVWWPVVFGCVGTLELLANSRCFAADKGATERPNIILIVADDLGYGDLGCYGQSQVKTPRIDRLAAEGMRFTDFYAGSTVCAPSRCVLMTGLHSGHAYIRGNGGLELRPQDVTVARLLQQSGYATGVFGKWGLGHENSTGIPSKQGFDRFYGYLDHGHAHNFYPTFLFRDDSRVKLDNVVPNEGRTGQGVATVRREYAPDLTTREMLAWLDEPRDRPFFLYWAPTIPHANNEAGKNGMEVPHLGEYADRDWPEPQKAFAAMMTRLDRDVGQLVDRLQEQGLAEKTILFFSSDNGPHREGGRDPDFTDSNGPLRGIKRDLYDGGIRVPLIAWGPGRVPKGATSGYVGSFADVLPTLCDLAGIEAPPVDGVSIRPTLLGQPGQKSHDYLYWEFYERGFDQAVRTDRFKGVRHGKAGPIELYDVTSDPGESKDIASQHPDVVQRIAEAMNQAHTPSPDWPQQRPGNRLKKKAG